MNFPSDAWYQPPLFLKWAAKIRTFFYPPNFSATFFTLFLQLFCPKITKHYISIIYKIKDFLTKKGCIAADQKKTALFQEERRLLIPNNNKA